MTEDRVSVGDGGIESTAITEWSGHGSGAFRADTQRASVIESRYGTDTRANSMNFKHGHGHGKSRDDGLAGGAQFAGEQRHIRGGAAHIEADAFVESRQFGGVSCADDAAGWTGEDCAHGLSG